MTATRESNFDFIRRHVPHRWALEVQKREMFYELISLTRRTHKKSFLSDNMRHTKKHHHIAGMSGIIHSLVDLNTGELKWNTSLTNFFFRIRQNMSEISDSWQERFLFIDLLCLNNFHLLMWPTSVWWRRVSGNLTDRWTFNSILTFSRQSISHFDRKSWSFAFNRSSA